MRLQRELRVAIDATPLLGTRTGVGHFCQELLRVLSGDHELLISAYGLTWRGRGQLAAELPPRARMVARPMAARPLRAAWKRWQWPPAEWWSGAVDVVHGTNFLVPPTQDAGRVVTVHDLTSLHFPQLCTADTREFPALVRRAVDRGAWVHTPSEFVAAEVVDAFQVPADRVCAIHHGIPAVSPLAQADPSRGHELAGSDQFILALGTIEPRKDLPGLVRAFDRLADDDPGAHLVVAGPDGWGLEAFARAVSAARHRSRIRRLPYVDVDEKAALLAGAKVFAYPSVYEGFGLPPLEAMTAGLPVVATGTGALPEVLDGAAELVPPNDVEALAGTLARLLEDDSWRAELVARGRRRAASFSWEKCGEAMKDLYRRVAANGR